MDRRRHFPTPKNAKGNRRRIPMTLPLPLIFLFILVVSHLVTTTTVVVIATDIVNGEESGAVTNEDFDDSAKLSGQQEQQAQLPGLDEKDETIIDRKIDDAKEGINSVGTTDDSIISEETPEDESIGISDSSSANNENSDQIEEAGDIVEKPVVESVIEDTTGSSEKIEIDMEEKSTESLEENKTEETEDNTLLSSQDETKDESSQEETTEVDATTTQDSEDLKEEEQETPSIASSSTSESDVEDEVETPQSNLDSETKKEEEIPKTTMVEDESLEQEEGQEESSTNDNTTSPDGQQQSTGDETKTQDGNSSSSSKEKQKLPSDEGEMEDDSYLDLDDQHEESESISSKEEDEIKVDHKDVESVIIEDENNEEVDREVNDKARARARAREDRRSRGTTNTTATEEPTVETTNSYRGEPWGQYRSTRRLPDLELLRLVFEDSNKTRENTSTGDVKSQKVVNDWQKDPLYDKKMAMDAGSGEPFLGDENDPKFREYRSRLLGENDGGTGNNSTKEDSQDIESSDVNANDNNADANSEFGEGLDDIDKFFEGVNPPDELDVGYGSSIQDVLMDKGKHILLKKVRGVARWIKIGWQTMGRKLEERISEFQLPFQKIDDTITASDSSKSVDTKAQRDRIVKNTREALITVWKVGKQTVEVVSDFVDGLIDRFDGRGEEDSANFEDFNGFDLDNLSNFQPPV